MLVWYAILTPLIMVGWNVGLEPAGIVPSDIGWVTALGLAVAFSLARTLLSSFRRTIVVNN